MPETNEETTLPDAIDQLYAAVAALVDPRKELVGGAVRAAPALYDALVGEIPAKSASGDNSRGVARSLPCVWLDAVDLRVRIDGSVKKWQPQGRSTQERLRALAARRWCPENTREVREYATEMQSWAITIRAMIEPAHVKSVSAACPNCNQRYFYRQHAGESLRQPALQLVIDQGCTCQICKSFWPPEKFLFLSRLLGLDQPAGVVLD